MPTREKEERLTLEKSEPVTLRPGDLLAQLRAIPPGRAGTSRRMFSAEEDQVILEGRARGVIWRNISRLVRCDEGTARRRYRELTAGGAAAPGGPPSDPR